MVDDRKASTQFGVVPPRMSASMRGQAAVPVFDDIDEDGGTVETHIPSPTATPETFGLEPGSIVAQYELIRELGRGGMGVVYAARDLRLGRRVAMKFLRHTDREVVERFLVEARATAQCNHDNIVIIYEVAEYQDMPYMVLEYLEGVSLRDLVGDLGEGRPLPAPRVIEIALPVAKALARAHELGIVHRDLKPENVIVTSTGQVKVLDFGIAKALGAAPNARRSAKAADFAPGSLTLTRQGEMVGTLPYMSPEQMGVAEIDARSDLFSLGMIMFELLSGEHAVKDLTADAMINNLIQPGAIRSIGSVVPDLPPGLIRIVDDLLKKVKVERIASATELAGRLEELLPGRQGRTLADGESPYPGLTAFQESDADRFFARDRDVGRMIARIREHPLTGVVGPSGVGKSSFIRAGVGPALKASGEPWETLVVRPGRHPLAALANLLEKFRAGGDRVASRAGGLDRETVAARLLHEPGFFGAQLRARSSAARTNLLVFVDQFEELYTLVPDLAERRAFTAALNAVADDTGAPLRVVLSIRSDFLDRVSEDPHFMEDLARGLVFLAAPDREGLRDALVKPTEALGFRFEDGIVDDMLSALADVPGALPLLQFAAAKLWDARDRDRRLLTVNSYTTIGGVTGALATHADEMVRTTSAQAQKLVQQIFRRLVTPERTRRVVELADLYALGDDAQRTIDMLVAARLLVVSGHTVEIVHESLIARWPMLRRWLDEDQEDAAFLGDLAVAAKQWDAKARPAGLVWRGQALDEARRWYLARPRTLGAREQAFLDAAFALAKRGRRIRTTLLVAAFAVLGAFAIVASIGLVQIRAAEKDARLQADEATTARKATDEALAKMMMASKEREAAEHRKIEAETVASKAMNDASKAEEERLKAEAEKRSVEAAAAESQAMSREQLVAKAAQLEAALVDSRSAQKIASAAAEDARKAKADLQVKLDAERARVKKLEEEMKSISTQLKD